RPGLRDVARGRAARNLGHAPDPGRQASRDDLLDRAPLRRGADVLRDPAPEPDTRMDARAVRDDEPARHPLHGRDRRLLPAGLDHRVFLLNNVHEDAPELFETRWALSYLRGPLTRAQIKTLMDPRRGDAPRPAPAKPAAVSGAAGGARPVLPPDIPQLFAPVR